MKRLLLFVLASLGVTMLSRRSLRQARSHGFYRFFAFEALAGLIVLNVPRWFHRPFVPRQILSWLVLAASGLLAIHGFYLLRVVGRPRAGRAEEATLIRGFEDTSELVRVGAYKYIRHPLYASLLLLGLGAYLKDPSPLATRLLLVELASLLATAHAEEAENLRHFGAVYADYMAETRMLLPCVL
jgi:protein-S-isoprenylcysteine O-methyltransferase Ste14